MTYFKDSKTMLEQTKLVDRFVEYAKIDTTADESSESCPSSECQWDLARKLVDELKELGVADANVNENCYVTGTLPGNTNGQTVGLIAHLDTSPAAPGKGVQPQFHTNYNGEPIRLKNDVVIDPADNPELKRCLGDTIITADGTTLLGADDKAGIAVIISAVEYYAEHPELPRPTIKIGFTPDEEIGRGALKFPIEEFGADVAFTLDGKFDGEINVETFNADSARITIEGVSTHPGTAKGKLVNALRYLARFIEMLPREHSPEETDDRQGFMHPMDVSGDATRCNCQVILRDFDPDGLKKWGERVHEIRDALLKEEPRLKVDVEIKHSYPNMYQILKDRPEITERLKMAVSHAGIEPNVIPVRGGTDGSNLTRMGLPCPNIFDGGMNFHGFTEWISTRSMGLSLCTVLNLLTLYAED